MVAIETIGLTKRFGDLVAVDHIDMSVEEGEVFGFLGPNGAGKSTTINLLLGYLDPSDGEARVLGHDIEQASLQVRDRIGVLPEGFTPYDRLTAREHVEYAGGLKNCSPDVDQLLDRVGLQREARDRRAGEFSTGMCQRLALATALVGEPDLLLLDEPSSGLDPDGMKEMRDLILEEAASGTTVFFSSHLLPEVEAICDQVGILVDGDLAAMGSIDELRDDTATNVPLEVTIDAIPDEVESLLAERETIRSVAIEDRTIRVEMSEPAEKIWVINELDKRATIEDVIAEETSLTSMFERYTSSSPGRSTEPQAAVSAEVVE